MRAVEVAAAVLAAATVFITLAVLGPSGCVVLVLVLAGAAILYTGTAQHRAPRPTIAPAPVAGPEPIRLAPAHPSAYATIVLEAPPVAECTDEALCWEWRRSFLLLTTTTEPTVVAHLAERRRVYLDELERRHPARFLAWIHSGARAAGDPTPFFHPQTPPGATPTG